MVLYRDKLPKFNNGRTEEQKGKMIFNWFEWKRDNSKLYPKIHPTQKPISLLKRLIEIFTDEGDVVIDPVARKCFNFKSLCRIEKKRLWL